MDVPVHVTPPFVNVATTVNVEVTGTELELVAVKAGTFPVPEVEPKPMSGFGTVLLQEKTAPTTLLVNTVLETEAPAQKVLFATASTLGFIQGLVTSIV